MDRMLRTLGVVLLVGGLAGAVWLYRQAAAPADGTIVIDEDNGLEDGLTPEDFKSSSRDMEAFGGKMWIVLAKWRRGLASLGRGRPLAVLLGIASVAAGLLLLRAGRSLPSETVSPGARDRADRDIPGPPANGA